VAAVFVTVIFFLGFEEESALALQQAAGKIELLVPPGGKSTFQWGLLSDGDKEIEVQLRAEGNGSEFMSFPSSVVLEPGKLQWVTVAVSIPQDHPGSVELQPSLFATELGETGGATVINIQMQKQVKLAISANPDPSLTIESTPLSREYPQIVRVGGEEIQLLIQSSSTITDFEFDEARKSLSFKVSGTGTESTVVHIDSVLNGPYGVNIDDEAAANHESIVSEEGTESIKIGYDQNTHTITISGTSVVPEFPIPIIIAVLTMTAAISGQRIRNSAKKNRLRCGFET
jgi:hypothetical protein